MKSEIFYAVEEGMPNPRDGHVGWRTWSLHREREPALKAARDLKLARVLECREVWLTKGVTTIKANAP